MNKFIIFFCSLKQEGNSAESNRVSLTSFIAAMNLLDSVK